MGGLPPDVLLIISVFAPLFTEAVWQRARVLLVGAILTPGRRTPLCQDSCRLTAIV